MPLDPKVIRDIYGTQEPLIDPFPTAKTYNPDQAAEGVKIGRAKGIDGLVAADNLPQLHSELDQDKWNTILQNAPNLAKQLQQPTFAAVAHDDTENLSTVEKIIKASQTKLPNPGYVAPGVPFRRLLDNPNGTFNNPVGYRDTLKAPNNNTDWLRGIGSKLAQVPELTRQALRLAGSDILGNLMDMSGVKSDATAQYQQAQARSNYDDPNFKGDPLGATVYSAANSAIQSLPPTLVGILTRNPNAAYATMAAQIAPTTYADTRLRGGSAGEAALNAGLQSAAEIVGNKSPMGFLVNRFGKENAGHFLAGYLGRELPTEIATEITQNAIDTAIANPNTTWQDFRNSIPDTVAQTALATLMTGGALHGAHKVAVSMLPDERAAQDAVQHRETLTQLDQASQASLVRARDPETFKQFVASAMEDGPISDVYIDAQKIIESGKAEQLAQVSPAIQSQLTEAAATGSMVRIPLEEYSAHIAGTELNQGLIDNIKLNPDGMSFAESEQFHQNYQAEFNAQVAKATEAQQGDDLFKASTAEVKSLLKSELNNVGHTSPSVNDTYATLASSYYAVRAAQMGITPKELYDTLPLRVTGERITGGLEQANAQVETPEFKNWFGDSKVVDTQGKPLVVYHGTGADFDAFNNSKTGQNYADKGLWGKGHYFSGVVRNANSYASRNEEGAKVIPAFVTIKNPLKLTTGKDLVVRLPDGTDYREYVKPGLDGSKIKDIAIAGGHDGIIQYKPDGGIGDLVVFNPTQIKSAVGNRGTFDPNDANILHQSSPVKHLKEAATDYALANFRDKTFTNKSDGAEIIVAKQGIKKATSGNVSKISAVALSKLNLLLEKATYVRSEQDRKNRDNIKEVRFYQQPVQLAGEKSTIEIVVRVAKDGSRYYDHFEVHKETSAPEERPLDSGSLAEVLSLDDAPIFSQDAGKVNQGNRGAYSPSENSIALLKNADLSTFLHELGHAFLTMDSQIVGDILAKENPTEGEQQVLQDMHVLFNWFGLEGSVKAQLLQWNGMTVDEQRPHHEKFAEGWEAYLFEGKAPSLELQPIFQRFRAWLANVYRSLSQYLKDAEETLTPEVTGVFDRMLASSEQIKQATQARGMAPIFQSAEEAGMTPEQYAQYHLDNMQSAQDAISELEAKSLKDMTWTSRLKEKTVARLNKEAAALRKELRKQVETEVNAEPVYSAMRFLKRGERINENGEIEKVEGEHRLSIEVLKETYPEINSYPADFEPFIAEAKKAENARDLYNAIAQVQGVSAQTSAWFRDKYDPNQTLSAKQAVEAFFNDIKNNTFSTQKTPSVDWKKLGYGAYGMLSENGLPPDTAAEMLGFTSGDELVRSLLEAEPRKDVIDTVTDQRMLEQHGELSSPEAISKAADTAIHNDVRTRVLSTELAGLQKALGSAQALSRMAKDYARTVVGKTKVKDLRPNKFAADAAKAGKRADEALRKGNRDEAITQKRNQLVNHATTKTAYEAQSEVSKIAQQFRKIVSAKTDNLKNTHNMDLVNATRAILAEYGIGARGQSAKEYIELVKAYDPELYAALEPDIVQAQQNAKEIKDLTIDELRALRDQVDSLWYLARREKQVEIDGKMVDRETIVKELSDRIDTLGVPDKVPGQEHAVTEKEKFARTLRGFRASLRRVESWTDRMDGGDIRGGFRRYLFTPISEAADAYRIDAAKSITKFRDLLKSIEPSLKPVRIEAPELGYTFGYSKGDAGMVELLHAVLHTGNESNKRKLLLGRGWATELEDKTLDTRKWDTFINRMISEGRLTKAHFDFAQGVWDLLEETKPLAQKTHREVFGRYFAEVTADSFTNQFGTYRGGYVPAITDTFEVQDAAINQALEDVNAGNAYMFPATSRGFTKSRVEYNRPLALDLRLLPQHIDKVILFAHMERHVRDVQRVLRKTQGKLNHYDPVAYTDMLLPWLNRAAKQVVQTPTTGTAGKAADRFFSKMRSRAGMSTMFANLTNALQQITGFSITLLKVKPTYLRQAITGYIKAPKEMARAASELSTFMAERLDQQSFHLRSEIEELLLNPSKYEQATNWTQKHAYFLQSAFQNIVDIASWTGAYNQALVEGQSDTDAIRFANSVVRQTQGSLKPEDVSRFETGSAFSRMFTQFASYFNMQANTLGTEFAKVSQDMGLRKGAGKAFYIFLFGFLVPAYVAEAIVRGMRGGGGDGDDDYLDEWLSFIFGTPLRNATAMVPIAGAIANRVAAGLTPQPYDDRMATAPAISAIESAANAPASVYKAIVENGRAKPAIKDTLSLITMVTGIPVNALGRPLGYEADVAQGKVEPTSTADHLRGLVTGAASSDSKR